MPTRYIDRLGYQFVRWKPPRLTRTMDKKSKNNILTYRDALVHWRNFINDPGRRAPPTHADAQRCSDVIRDELHAMSKCETIAELHARWDANEPHCLFVMVAIMEHFNDALLPPVDDDDNDAQTSDPSLEYLKCTYARGIFLFYTEKNMPPHAREARAKLLTTMFRGLANPQCEIPHTDPVLNGLYHLIRAYLNTSV